MTQSMWRAVGRRTSGAGEHAVPHMSLSNIAGRPPLFATKTEAMPRALRGADAVGSLPSFGAAMAKGWREATPVSWRIPVRQYTLAHFMFNEQNIQI